MVRSSTQVPFLPRRALGALYDLPEDRVRVVAGRVDGGPPVEQSHGPAVMFHSVGESMAVYRAPHKKVNAYSVYTNCVPVGVFRGYGLGQVTFAVESAMDELARWLVRGGARPGPAEPVPAAGLRRGAAYRGALHPDLGRHRAAGRQVHEREPVQPRRPRVRQCAAGRHRVRFTEVPLLRDEVWLALEEHRAAGAVQGWSARRHPSREGSV